MEGQNRSRKGDFLLLIFFLFFPIKRVLAKGQQKYVKKKIPLIARPCKEMRRWHTYMTIILITCWGRRNHLPIYPQWKNTIKKIDELTASRKTHLYTLDTLSNTFSDIDNLGRSIYIYSTFTWHLMTLPPHLWWGNEPCIQQVKGRLPGSPVIILWVSLPVITCTLRWWGCKAGWVYFVLILTWCSVCVCVRACRSDLFIYFYLNISRKNKESRYLFYYYY